MLVTRIFQGKADSAILLGFECTINPQNFMNIVWAIFEKMKILNFFLCELPLILRVGGKLKKMARDICTRTLYIEFERDRSIGLGSTFDDGHTENKNKRYGHTAHTFSRLMLKVIIWGRFIVKRSAFPITDNNTFLAVYLLTQYLSNRNNGYVREIPEHCHSVR